MKAKAIAQAMYTLAKDGHPDVAEDLLQVIEDPVQKEIRSEIDVNIYMLTVYTYESHDYPILAHIFFGESEEEARGYMKAHKKTDAFFSGCEEGQWEDIDCTNTDPKLKKLD